MNALEHDPLTLAYHELRSPLGLLATAAQALAEEAQDDDQRRRCEVIVRAATRMLRTTEQVFSVVGASTVEAAEWYAPAAEVRALVTDLAEADARIEIHADSAAEQARVYGVRGLFEVLVQSLVMNAINHSNPGATVTLALSADADHFSLTITNPMATHRRHAGLGVGVYLCGRLAAQIGASLRAEPAGLLYQARVQLPVVVDQFDLALRQRAAEPWAAHYVQLLAWADPLTGLLTERAFLDLLAREEARAQRFAMPVAVALVRVEGVGTDERVSEGRLTDEALRAIGEAVRASARLSDVVARIDDRVIAVLLLGTDDAGAEVFVARLIAACQRLRPVHGADSVARLSAGAATRAEAGTLAEALRLARERLGAGVLSLPA